MFLVFAGCSVADFGGGGADSDLPRSLNGTKVLSRPAQYSLSEAVGEDASQYFYNIFAYYILNGLYEVYETTSTKNEEKIFKDLESSNGETFGQFTDTKENDKYYLYDSLRYTISSITNTYDANTDLTQQVLVLDASSAWNWTIRNNAKNAEIFYERLKELNSETETIVTVSEDKTNNKITIVLYETDILSVYTSAPYNTHIPSFSQYYSGVNVKHNDNDNPDTNGKYYYSPYYQQLLKDTKDINDKDLTNAVNYLQDALEYATYLFVMGYDYVNVSDNGTQTETEDAKYFDFELEYTDGAISGMKVGGWGANKISIVEALGKVKALYQEKGAYIGVTEANKKQIVRFIQDKVVGSGAYAKDKFTINIHKQTQDANGVTTDQGIEETKSFNRNYDKIIENIVDYACEQTPIGKNDDEVVTLSEPYLISQITDYEKEYFFLNDVDDEGNDTDEELFKNIDAAEYQSMVIYPLTADISDGKSFTGMWLAFEYYENPDASLTNATSITINVGFRYFSCAGNNGDGEIVFSGETQITVGYGKNGEVDGGDPMTLLTIGNDKTYTNDIQFDKNIPLSKFNTNIGDGAIDPFASGTEIESHKSSVIISGTSKARDYYKLNASSSYGYYGTLNEAKFSKNSAGDDACDFIEVYFDIVKDKNASGINYNFKVGLSMVATEVVD